MILNLQALMSGLAHIYRLRCRNCGTMRGDFKRPKGGEGVFENDFLFACTPAKIKWEPHTHVSIVVVFI